MSSSPSEQIGSPKAATDGPSVTQQPASSVDEFDDFCSVDLSQAEQPGSPIHGTEDDFEDVPKPEEGVTCDHCGTMFGSEEADTKIQIIRDPDEPSWVLRLCQEGCPADARSVTSELLGVAQQSGTQLTELTISNAKHLWVSAPRAARTAHGWWKGTLGAREGAVQIASRLALRSSLHVASGIARSADKISASASHYRKRQHGGLETAKPSPDTLERVQALGDGDQADEAGA